MSFEMSAWTWNLWTWDLYCHCQTYIVIALLLCQPGVRKSQWVGREKREGKTKTNQSLGSYCCGWVTIVEPASRRQYFTMPPHSMWNPHGIKILNGFHVESIWNMFQPIIEVFSTMDSTWNLSPFHMESISIPHGIIPHGFHMDSAWIPHGFLMDSM